MDLDPKLAVRLADVADRLDDLAEIAELMGDDDGAARYRHQSSRCREQAMTLLDASPSEARRGRRGRSDA